MEEDPHQLLEGIAIACHAIGSHTAYIYLRYEYGRCYRVLDAAIKECYAAGMLGKNILGSGFDLDVHLHRGAAAYICGEETGLIESLEGKRAWPRIKPPFPAIEGLFRKPTIVNNVETLCCVTHILDRGVDWFKSIGVPPDPNNPRDVGSYGPKLYCISGHVNKPCCVELPLGVTHPRIDRRLRRRRVEGPQGQGDRPRRHQHGLLDAPAELDTPLDFNGPGKAGCLGLGTAAVVVVDDQTSMVDVLYNCCRFMSARILRPVHALPRGHQLDATRILERIRAGPRAGRGSRYALGGRRVDGHHTRHDDLRPGRRRRLAGEERHPQVPHRVRRLHHRRPHKRKPRRRADGCALER